MVALETVDRYDGDDVPRLGDRAVVVGGSIAGLCVARVLADAFDEVVVVDRDSLSEDAVVRDGAPQTSHPHVLLEAGRATLEDFCPGFCESVLSAGGLLIDAATDMRYYDEGDFLADGPNRLPMYCASRPLFESVIRQHVLSLSNVRLRDDCQFTTYRTDETGERITGAVIRTDGDVDTLEADLVVDATGRASRTPTWLENNGYVAPPVDEVAVDVTYSTISVERSPTDRYSLFVPPNAPRTRGGAAVPIEGHRWEVILQGVHGDETPTDADGFVSFAESLPVTEIRNLVTDNRWVSDDIRRYPFPSSIRRQYDRLDRFPEGLLVTGDAIASFNPIYGQGMSVAAMDALLLHHSLADGGLEDLAARFFERNSKLVDAVWAVAVGADFEFSQTTGPKPRGIDLVNWYVSRLIRRAQTDGVLTDAFYRVFRLEHTPATLFRPRILWRVLGPRTISYRTN